MEDLRKQANDLLCYYGKMQNRLSQAGLGDTGSLVKMFAHLQHGLDAIAFEELDPAIQEVGRLVESLSKMQADLNVLKALKTQVDKTRVLLDHGDSAKHLPAPNGDGARAA